MCKKGIGDFGILGEEEAGTQNLNTWQKRDQGKGKDNFEVTVVWFECSTGFSCLICPKQTC
jgi:hypothetical protein